MHKTTSLHPRYRIPKALRSRCSILKEAAEDYSSHMSDKLVYGLNRTMKAFMRLAQQPLYREELKQKMALQVERIAAARDQSRVTHHDPRCAAGAVAIAGAVALSLLQRPIVVERFLAKHV